MADVGRRLLKTMIQEAKRQGHFQGLADDVLVTALLGIPVTYLSTVYVPNEPNWRHVRNEIERLVRRLAGERDSKAAQMDASDASNGQRQHLKARAK